ncbi:ATP-binding protein [Candidatus Woesearchaeota archaeon]|nr:ATP-binding protein [Candidatus Woesearchaeota archaeon]
MLFSLIGAHGTGKTTVFNALQTRHPEWQFFSEGIRHQIPAFGYHTPYELIDAVGIGVFEVMNINSWSVIDPQTNPLINPDNITITDRSVLDNLGYFLTLKQKSDTKLEPLIRKMVTHYASLTDHWIYFPIGVFPLVGDTMRPQDDSYQQAIDLNIRRALKELKISPKRVHYLSSSNLEGRIDEVLTLIQSFSPP